MTAAQQVRVAAPDFVVVARAGKSEVISDAAMVSVAGGRRFAGNGYRSGEPFGKHFSFGVDAPTSVGVVTRSGQKRAITDAQKVLFCGGSDPARAPSPSAGADLSQLIADHEPTSSLDIFDENDEVHIVDNDATIEMADRFKSGPDDFDETVRARNKAMQ